VRGGSSPAASCALRLKPGSVVADIGAGSGCLLPHLSRAVRPSGTVYAQEVQPSFLPELRHRSAKLKNVRVLLGTPSDPRLPKTSMDCFVLLAVCHEIEWPLVFLRALRQAARSGARLAIIDFDASRKGDPPAPQGHQIADVQVIAEAQACGWRLVERHEWLPSQFFLLFQIVPDKALPERPLST
jgi:ubiquinone/menaquinone biosynthesis C-methylase UbiE